MTSGEFPEQFVDITDFDPVDLFQALYNAARPPAVSSVRGLYQLGPKGAQVAYEETEGVWEELWGRKLYIDLRDERTDEERANLERLDMDVTQYNRFNGEGLAQEVIGALLEGRTYVSDAEREGAVLPSPEAQL
jgi:hypothetical protein